MYYVYDVCFLLRVCAFVLVCMFLILRVYTIYGSIQRLQQPDYLYINDKVCIHEVSPENVFGCEKS